MVPGVDSMNPGPFPTQAGSRSNATDPAILFTWWIRYA